MAAPLDCNTRLTQPGGWAVLETHVLVHLARECSSQEPNGTTVGEKCFRYTGPLVLATFSLEISLVSTTLDPVNGSHLPGTEAILTHVLESHLLRMVRV